MHPLLQITVAILTGFAMVLACGNYAAQRFAVALGCAAVMVAGIAVLGCLA